MAWSFGFILDVMLVRGTLAQPMTTNDVQNLNMPQTLVPKQDQTMVDKTVYCKAKIIMMIKTFVETLVKKQTAIKET